MVDLDGMLSRLPLGVIREQLYGLLEAASRRQLKLRDALAWLCAAEVLPADLPSLRARHRRQTSGGERLNQEFLQP